MIAAENKIGITLVEVLVIIAVAGMLAALVLPALQASREANRLTACANNLRTIGAAFHEYHQSHKRFPPAATLAGIGNVKTVGGWSCLVRLLPFLDQAKLYDSLNIKTDNPFDGSPATAAADRTLVVRFVCPSNAADAFLDATKRTGSLTNYKTIGATTKEGLNMALTNMGAVGEAPAPHVSQPDGAIYPGSTTNLDSFNRDGAAHTILCAETTDRTASRWIVGGDSTLAGLPTGAKTGAVSFAINGAWGDYAAPDGFGGKFKNDGKAANTTAAYARFLTYLDPLFYSPISAGPNVYGQRDSGSPVSGNASESLGDPKLGPSSSHPSLVNHLFADGAVKSINTDVDVATYMFMITRDDGGPTDQFFYSK